VTHAYRPFNQQIAVGLSDAQSLAVGHDHPAIEPAHLMQALLEQQGGSIKPC
jgi:ATP-dependent Clp protease ATP-binding subunit ClpB